MSTVDHIGISVTHKEQKKSQYNLLNERDVDVDVQAKWWEQE